LRLVNILKHFAFIALINSSRVKVAENRGQEIVEKIFQKLSSDNGYKLLPEDFQSNFFLLKNEMDPKRLICDFIAGMTDRYALEFYGRLYSENPQSIFKPL
ncbi:MAG: deoxyguanosinetriphosphate triphosphohydrolase, partial [Ruminococcaceae bacterium]|nr:deoxyguanosinetriphosphate triphosphohydrolase [Oscillospiraceae bacterium]